MTSSTTPPPLSVPPTSWWSRQPDWESGPGRLTVYEIRTGRLGALRSPESASTHPSAADEIMVSTIAYSFEARLRSLELLAEAWDH